MLVLYSALTVPFAIGFDQTTGLLAIFELFSDFVFIADLFANFFVTFQQDGVYVTSGRTVALAYARGWFAMDILATFPVHWITDGGLQPTHDSTASGVGSINKLLRLLRLFKLFRLLRLIKLFPRLFAVFETSVKVDPAILRFLRSSRTGRHRRW